VVNGLLVAYAGLAPFIVTLATLFGVRGLVYQLTNAGATTYSVPGTSTFAQLGTGTWLTLGIPVFITVAAYATAHVALERTPYGVAVQSIGGGESAATLMGLGAKRVKVTAYVICAALAGIAGMLQAAQLVSASPIIATGYELQAIATVVIGGTLLTGGSGSMLGTGAGVLLLGVINSFIVELQLDSTWNNVVSGGFLIVVVVLQRLLNHRRSR
jgi:ribose/xylose/arabinose/galactoside ABC-type transport system permease subunit